MGNGTSQKTSWASSCGSLKNSLVLTVCNGAVALKSNGCGDYDLPLRASGKTHYDPSRNRDELICCPGLGRFYLDLSAEPSRANTDIRKCGITTPLHVPIVE